MPIHIDEVQTDVRVPHPSRSEPAAHAPVPGQVQADWRRLRQQAQTDRARTSAWGNDTGDGPEHDD